MVKQMHNLVLNRRSAKDPWGFRIIGGKDEGLSVKIGKITMGSPAEDAGLQSHDFLVSVNGQDVFNLSHQQIVKLIKNAGNSINLSIERGDHIVPNFEEIWPSGKQAEKNKVCDPAKGINYVLSAMNEGVPGQRNSLFTTVGKPRVETHQYDNPINCYSEEMLKEMSEKGTWKRTISTGLGGESTGTATFVPPPPGAASLGMQVDTGVKFNPQNSSVLACLNAERR